MSDYYFNQKINTKHFEIGIDLRSRYGYFEHIHLGDECGGGLWFDDEMFLVDYDGVFSLPEEVYDALSEHHYLIDSEDYCMSKENVV